MSKWLEAVCYTRSMIKKKREVKLIKRNSGIELLRIIAMMLIIAHHFAIHTEWPIANVLAFNAYCIELLKSFGKIGAAIFFIISGYFIAKNKERKNSRKLLRTAMPTWFYSIVFLIMSTSLGYNINIKFPLDQKVIQSIFPILLGSYWFISQYVILELISPYLKRMTDSLKTKELFLLIAMYITTCWGAGALSYFISGIYSPIIALPSFLLFALVGIMIYRVEDKIKTKDAVCALVLSSIILAIGPFIIEFLSSAGYANVTNLFWQFDSPLCIITASAMFVIFKRLEFKSRAINAVAETTLGVYLIHDNVFIRQLLWNSGKIIDVQAHIYDDKLKFILFSIGIILSVFVISSAIEHIRSLIMRIIFKKKTK